MTTFDQLANRIIREQELIIGPLAWSEAEKVSGFSVLDKEQKQVSFLGDQKEAINQLVTRYERLFGKASQEVCREAVQDLVSTMPSDEIPASLK